MKKYFILSVIFSQFTFAEQSVPFKVNVETIKNQILVNNHSLQTGIYNVQLAKQNVDQARAKLLPSLNLGLLLPALANPTFLLASVTTLFPFLIPSNWAVYKQEQSLFLADKESFKVLQLNILSSAYSLYFTTLNDQKMVDAYQKQADSLVEIYNNLKDESEVLGNIPEADLEMANAQLKDAQFKLSKLTELVREEKINLKYALGFSVDGEITLEDSTLKASSFEDKGPRTVMNRAFDVSPEIKQLHFLEDAAKSGVFNKKMSFFSTASLSGLANGNNSAFDNLKIGGALSIGFDYGVNISIAENNLYALKQREVELGVETMMTSEIIVGHMSEVKKQLDLVKDSLKSRLNVYEFQRDQYSLGLISLQTLLQTQSLLADAYANVFKTELDYNTQRVAFLRLIVDSSFSEVKECSGNLDQFKGKSIPLDVICRQ